VKDFDAEIAKRIRTSHQLTIGNRIIVEFCDGEKIEGHTVGGYKPQAPRFYVAPKTEKGRDENMLFVLIERKFTRKIAIYNEQS